MNRLLHPDLALLQRHDRPGLRYTPYQTAPQFSETFGEAELCEAITASNGDPIPRPLSLYVHVPFCNSPCFYCGCNRVITRDPARGVEYLSDLMREIERVAQRFDRDREVVQVHFGGGTPNFLAPAQLRDTLEALQRQFTFSQARERDISIELDPRFVTPAQVGELARAGFNRASLGVQDFDPDVQRAVNRVQGVGQTLAVLQACQAHGMRSINVDLIYGLPRQRLAGFSQTLDTVVDARPDRVAIYSYAHMPALFKAQARIELADLPSPALKLELLGLAIERLTAAGYLYIGMDHFALPDDELALAQARGGLHRNFMGYTTHADSDLVGLGVSAISHVGDSYSQNPRDIAAWRARIDQGQLPVFRGLVLGEDELLRADVIQSLMCQGHVPMAALERRYGIDFNAYFASSLARLQVLQADGLVRVDTDSIEVTPAGRLLLRVVAACFDAYLPSAAARPVAVLPTRGAPALTGA